MMRRSTRKAAKSACQKIKKIQSRQHSERSSLFQTAKTAAKISPRGIPVHAVDVFLAEHRANPRPSCFFPKPSQISLAPPSPLPLYTLPLLEYADFPHTTTSTIKHPVNREEWIKSLSPYDVVFGNARNKTRSKFYLQMLAKHGPEYNLIVKKFKRWFLVQHILFPVLQNGGRFFLLGGNKWKSAQIRQLSLSDQQERDEILKRISQALRDRNKPKRKAPATEHVSTPNSKKSKLGSSKIDHLSRLSPNLVDGNSYVDVLGPDGNIHLLYQSLIDQNCSDYDAQPQETKRDFALQKIVHPILRSGGKFLLFSKGRRPQELLVARIKDCDLILADIQHSCAVRANAPDKPAPSQGPHKIVHSTTTTFHSSDKVLASEPSKPPQPNPQSEALHVYGRPSLLLPKASVVSNGTSTVRSLSMESTNPTTDSSAFWNPTLVHTPRSNLHSSAGPSLVTPTDLSRAALWSCLSGQPWTPSPLNVGWHQAMTFASTINYQTMLQPMGTSPNSNSFFHNGLVSTEETPMEPCPFQFFQGSSKTDPWVVDLTTDDDDENRDGSILSHTSTSNHADEAADELPMLELMARPYVGWDDSVEDSCGAWSMMDPMDRNMPAIKAIHCTGSLQQGEDPPEESLACVQGVGDDDAVVSDIDLEEMTLCAGAKPTPAFQETKEMGTTLSNSAVLGGKTQCESDSHSMVYAVDE